MADKTNKPNEDAIGMMQLKADVFMPSLLAGVIIRARVARGIYDAFIEQKFTPEQSMQFTRDYLVEFDKGINNKRSQ